MAFEFQRIDQFMPGDLERAGGATALVVQKRLEAAQALESTFILGRKAFRLLADRLPAGHRPLDLLEAGSGREERAARAYERVRRAVDLVPSVAVSTERCLVWSSPVLRPRKRSLPALLAVIDAPRERLTDAVLELWAAVFLAPVFERAAGRIRRLEVAIGITEDKPEARAALLAALASADLRGEPTLPPPGQGDWEVPPLAFDRSLERLRARARRPVLKRAFGTPALNVVMGPMGSGLDAKQVEALLSRQKGGIGAAVACDVLGPVEAAPDAAMSDQGALDWARLGAQIAVHVAQMAELGREVERWAAQAQRRHDWLLEMDLQLLPDDGLKTTLEEQLALIPSVTQLALRADLAAARLARTYAALSGDRTGELDLGIRFPLMHLLSDFEDAAREFMSERRAGGATGPLLHKATEYLAERHREIFPRTEGEERASLQRALERVVLQEVELPSVERLIEVARVRGDEGAARFEARLPRLLASRVSPLRALVRDSSLLRERARQLEVLVDAMLRAVALEVDRRLPQLEPGLPKGSVWHCYLEEILETVGLRGRSLRARVVARSAGEAAYHAATTLRAPRPLDFTGQGRPTPLSKARALDRAVLLLLAPDEISYSGRALDTLPCLARALGLPWGLSGRLRDSALRATVQPA